MKATLSQLVRWVVDGRMTSDAAFAGVSTDSRQVRPGNLFIALNGENFDAHRFLADVADKGASAVLVERLPENYPLPALVVANTRLAMGEIAMNWRRQFRIPVVGVTGSNGKTTVKEMIASIFRAAYGDDAYLATSGNFNNDIGVPLTIFRLEEMHKAAVIELGSASIRNSCKVLKPSRGKTGRLSSLCRKAESPFFLSMMPILLYGRIMRYIGVLSRSVFAELRM